MTAPFTFDVGAALARIAARKRAVDAGSPALSQMSRLSQAAPPAAALLADLTPDQHDTYEERAAILEYDAHLPRPEAERLAAEMTRQQRRADAA